jgi:hypothetical protein
MAKYLKEKEFQLVRQQQQPIQQPQQEQPVQHQTPQQTPEIQQLTITPLHVSQSDNHTELIDLSDGNDSCVDE